MTSAQPAASPAAAMSGRTAWGRNLAAPVRDFLSTESGGAVVLLGATLAALIWIDSPWSDSYGSRVVDRVSCALETPASRWTCATGSTRA